MICDGVRGAGGLPLGPPGGGRPPTCGLEDPAVHPGSAARRRRMERPGLADHPHDAARPTAGVAGLRSARMGVVGPRPATTSVAGANPRAGRDGDLPWPAGLPAAHQVSPPLPGCQALTSHQADRHGQVGAASCSSTVRSGGRVCRARSGCRRRPLELMDVDPWVSNQGGDSVAEQLLLGHAMVPHEHMHHGRPPRRAGALAAGGPELGRPPLRRPCRGPLGSAAAGSCVLCRCRTRPGSPPHRRCGSGRSPRSARSPWGLGLGRRRTGR
jgi:hypothetical protein